MKKNNFHTTSSQPLATFARLLATVATVLEFMLGAMVLIACIFSAVGLLCTTDTISLFKDPSYLQNRISDACLIIIGVEFIKMITSFTVDAVVDLVLLAVARQLIVEHTAPLENLFTVLAIGLLFLIRRFVHSSPTSDGAHAPEQFTHTE